MSKFNTPTVSRSTKTTNLAGGEAFQQSPKFEFACLLLTSFLKDQFYRSEAETVTRLRSLLAGSDPRFAAKTAIYARHEFGMRSITHFVAAELARTVKGERWTAAFFDRVVRRADDVTEILACYLAQHKKPVPNALKRGLGRALGRFDEYTLAKYRQSGASLSLVDAVNLLHPKHTEALGKLVNGTLPVAETWETKLTRAGQIEGGEEAVADAKTAQWEALVRERKLGYMALVRNLRNILTAAPAVIPEVCIQLRNADAIKRSLMFPHRFLMALEIVRGISGAESHAVMEALHDAVELSLSNVPRFDGRTLVVLDSSGSMSGKPAEIGSLFAATLLKANGANADFMLFSDDASYVNVSSRDSLMTIAKSIPFISGGTNFHSIFARAARGYDRVVILSDMQGWVGGYAPTSTFAQFVARTNKRPKIYSFDLQGYGTLQFPEQDVFCLAGFSDKVFDIMALLEQDRNALLAKIENIEL